MRRTLSWALGFGALLSGAASPAWAQQWFFYPTNAPAAQQTQAAYPYMVPADFPRPYGPAPVPPAPNVMSYRPAPMPQTIYYPMPNQMTMPVQAAPMPPAGMAPAVQRAADASPAPTPAPMPLPPAGAAPVNPTPPAPVLVHDPVEPEIPVPGTPVGVDIGPRKHDHYDRVPASVLAADNSPDTPSPCDRWIGGGSVLIIKPYINNNVAFTTDRLSTARTLGAGGVILNTASTNVRTAADFEYDYTVSPYVWIGHIDDRGFGWRADAFHFDQRAQNITTQLGAAEAFVSTPTSTTSLSIAPPTTVTGPLPLAGFVVSAPTAVTAADTSGLGSDTLSFGSRLRIEYYDLEAACDLQLGRCWSLLLTGGGRYLHMGEDYGEEVSGTGIPAGGAGLATERQVLLFGHNFTGGGPTAALQARWAHGGSNLAFFGSMRGSLLVGRERLGFLFSDVITDPNLILGNSSLTSSFGDRRDLVLPVVEIEVGVEYAVCLDKVRPFVRAGAINQTYFGFGSASQLDSNLGLFGAEVALGLNY
jgi:hypothetical protein